MKKIEFSSDTHSDTTNGNDIINTTAPEIFQNFESGSNSCSYKWGYQQRRVEAMRGEKPSFPIPDWRGEHKQQLFIKGYLSAVIEEQKTPTMKKFVQKFKENISYKTSPEILSVFFQWIKLEQTEPAFPSAEKIYPNNPDLEVTWHYAGHVTRRWEKAQGIQATPPKCPDNPSGAEYAAGYLQAMLREINDLNNSIEFATIWQAIEKLRQGESVQTTIQPVFQPQCVTQNQNPPKKGLLSCKEYGNDG